MLAEFTVYRSQVALKYMTVARLMYIINIPIMVTTIVVSDRQCSLCNHYQVVDCGLSAVILAGHLGG